MVKKVEETNRNGLDGDRAVREGWSEEKPIRGRVGEGLGLVAKPVKGPWGGAWEA